MAIDSLYGIARVLVGSAQENRQDLNVLRGTYSIVYISRPATGERLKYSDDIRSITVECSAQGANKEISAYLTYSINASAQRARFSPHAFKSAVELLEKIDSDMTRLIVAKEWDSTVEGLLRFRKIPLLSLSGVEEFISAHMQ